MSPPYMKAYYYTDIRTMKTIFHLPRVFYVSQSRGPPNIVLNPSKLEELALDFLRMKGDIKKNLIYCSHFDEELIRESIVNPCFDSKSYLAKDYVKKKFNEIKMWLRQNHETPKKFDAKFLDSYDPLDDLEGYDPRFRPEF
ncbi:MAG: hypothetical protein ACP5OG_05465 [Candidatus Nanoarchaeia archaeon]